MQGFQQQTLTHTTTKQQTRCIHSGALHLQTGKDNHLITKAVSKPSMQPKRLSFTETAYGYGRMTFTENSGHIAGHLKYTSSRTQNIFRPQS